MAMRDDDGIYFLPAAKAEETGGRQGARGGDSATHHGYIRHGGKDHGSRANDGCEEEGGTGGADSLNLGSYHPLLKRYVDLKSAPEKALGISSGIFVAEGPEALRHLLNSETQIESLLLKRSVYERMRKAIAERRIRDAKNGVPFKVFVSPSQRNFTEAVGYNARGALSCGYIPEARDEGWLRHYMSLRCDSHPWRILAVDGCNNPANLGNLIRSAAALEVDAVLLSDDCCDAWYRRSIRVSMGCCFRLPIVRCNLAKVLEMLRAEDCVATFAAVISSSAGSLSDLAKHAVNCNHNERWCCVVGSEASGISPEVQAVCEWHVRIPMARNVDSLSITTACAIMLSRLRDTAQSTTMVGCEGGGTLDDSDSDSTECRSKFFPDKHARSLSIFFAGILIGLGLNRMRRLPS